MVGYIANYAEVELCLGAACGNWLRLGHVSSRPGWPIQLSSKPYMRAPHEASRAIIHEAS